MLFGLGVPELVIILVVALIIFGPRKLPELGAALGKGLRELRKGTEDIKGDFKSAKEDIESAVDFEDDKEKEMKTEAKKEETGDAKAS